MFTIKKKVVAVVYTIWNRCHVTLNMTTDIIIVTIKSLNLPRLEDDVIAEAEYSPEWG